MARVRKMVARMPLVTMTAMPAHPIGAMWSPNSCRLKLNGGAAALTLDNLVVGRVLGLAESGPAQVHLLDAVVARNFYLLQHHLRSFEDGFEETTGEIDALLRSGKCREFFTLEEIPALTR